MLIHYYTFSWNKNFSLFSLGEKFFEPGEINVKLRLKTPWEIFAKNPRFPFLPGVPNNALDVAVGRHIVTAFSHLRGRHKTLMQIKIYIVCNEIREGKERTVCCRGSRPRVCLHEA